MAQVFISYARSDGQDPLHRRFCDELARRLAGRLGVPVEEAVFLDRSGIQVGDAWERTLSDALTGCRCFLAILSPAYRLSDMCGREWGAFARRAAEQAEPGEVASALLPVMWQPIRLPREAAGIQWAHASLGKRYSRSGLSELAHLHPQELDPFIEAFSEHVFQVVIRHGLPPARKRIDLRGARNPFRTRRWTRKALAAAVLLLLSGIAAAGLVTAQERSAHASRAEVERWLSECAGWRDPGFPETPAPAAALERLRDRDLLELAHRALRECPAATDPLVAGALQRMPRAPEAWWLEGERRYASRNYPGAREAFDRAIALGGRGEVVHARARALRQLGDLPGYQRDLDQACQQGDHGACDLR